MLKAAFYTFHCGFLSDSPIHWLRIPIYSLNDSISVDIISHTIWHQPLCIQEMHTLCLFVGFVCSVILIVFDIGNSFWSFQWLDWLYNWQPSMMSSSLIAQHYCLHKCHRSPKHINEGASKMATTHDLTLYSPCPHASVISSQRTKPGGKCFIFLSRQLFLQTELVIKEFALFLKFNIIYLSFCSIKSSVK